MRLPLIATVTSVTVVSGVGRSQPRVPDAIVDAIMGWESDVLVRCALRAALPGWPVREVAS